jgi:hypothetical protein
MARGVQPFVSNPGKLMFDSYIIGRSDHFAPAVRGDRFLLNCQTKNQE